jgi:hypothetical protein
MTGWVVVVTAFLGLARVHDYVVACPTAACVFEIENHARANHYITRMQVWSRARYARLPVSGKYIWPPQLDLQFQ